MYEKQCIKCTYIFRPVEGVGGKLWKPDLYKSFDWALTSLWTTMLSFFMYFHNTTTADEELLSFSSLRNRGWDVWHPQITLTANSIMNILVCLQARANAGIHMDEQPPHNNSITANMSGPKPYAWTHTLCSSWNAGIRAATQKTQTHTWCVISSERWFLQLWGDSSSDPPCQTNTTPACSHPPLIHQLMFASIFPSCDSCHASALSKHSSSLCHCF